MDPRLTNLNQEKDDWVRKINIFILNNPSAPELSLLQEDGIHPKMLSLFYQQMMHALSDDAKENEKNHKRQECFPSIEYFFYWVCFPRIPWTTFLQIWAFFLISSEKLLHVRCVSHCYTRVSITKSDILAWEMTLSSLLYCVMWRLNILTRLQLLPM